MRLLLDTHALLWWAENPDQLSSIARGRISDIGSTVYVSAASVWEMCIKQAMGKLSIPDDVPALLVANSFNALDINVHHTMLAAGLPSHHRDPFDRMLVAQAMIEKLTLVSRDIIFSRYDVPVITA